MPPISALTMCKNAHMNISRRRRISADNLLVLLAVGRLGRFTSAAESLELNHTTVSRRIAELEATLGGPVLTRTSGGLELTDLGREALAAAEQVEGAIVDLRPHGDGTSRLQGLVRVSTSDGFGAHIAGPALARVQRRHPRLSIEIVTATRRASQYRSGVDLEIIVGEQQVYRAESSKLTDYTLSLYATAEYLASAGTPSSAADLAGHPLVYYIESMLQVDDLDAIRRGISSTRDSLTSTNVFVQLEATRAGAGIGLLPRFMAAPCADLVPVLADTVSSRLSFWLVARRESLRRPAVAAVVDGLRDYVAEHQSLLVGELS